MRLAIIAICIFAITLEIGNWTKTYERQASALERIATALENRNEESLKK